MEGTCASPYRYARLYLLEDVSSAGKIELTTSGCGEEGLLEVPSGRTLTSTGTIELAAGTGGVGAVRGSGTVVNKGTVSALAGASSAVSSSTLVNEGLVALADKSVTAVTGTFKNAAGGSVSGSGSGHLQVWDGGTYVQAAGKTEGAEPVVAEQAGYLEYTGGGESHVFVRDASDAYLKGALAEHQTLTVEGTCASPYKYARLYLPEDVSSAGKIELTTSGCGEVAQLEIPSSRTLTNTGTIKFAPGAGGEAELIGSGTLLNSGAVTVAAGGTAGAYSPITNEGAFSIADEAQLSIGGTFTNDTGGSVAGAESGDLLVTGTFVEGAGTTTGSRPVVMEGGTLEYAGSGASRIYARGYYTELYGNISKEQELVVDGSCEGSYHEGYVRLNGEQVNEGTIVLSSDCEAPARLYRNAAGTLTNKGTIKALAGAGGERWLYTNVDNEGVVEVAGGVELYLYGYTFTNDSGGSVVGVGSGHVLGASKFVEGAGTTTGSRPVVMEGGTLEYAGSGASRIYARGYYTELSGNISKEQELVVDGSCESSYHEGRLYLNGEQVNEGTIVLSSDCEAPSRLYRNAAGALTNKGTIKVLAGAGGERETNSAIINEGTLAIDAGVQLDSSGAFTQGRYGTLQPAIASASSFGALSVSGTATIAGTIEPSPQGGFKAAGGDKFAVLAATPRSGTFEFEKDGSIGGGLYYKPVYTTTGATLEASESAPEGLPQSTTPPHIFGSARQGHTLLLTHGTWTHSPFEYADQWLLCNPSGANCKAIPGAHYGSFVLTHADVGQTIRVQETATNSAGEGPAAESAATEKVSELELHADAGDSITTYVGHEAVLDASASTPTGEIESYRWDFGDGHGTTTTNPIVHHTYTEPTNSSPLHATVTVKEGSEEVTSAPIEITVLPAPEPSKALTVTVEDEHGNALDGAEVVYIAGDGTKTQARTEGGHALLAGLPDGSDTLYAYAAGYRPVAFHATVEEGHGTASVRLSSGAITEAKLKSKELTLEQIEAAGIDTSDPANRLVYDFELRLNFTNGYDVQPLELKGAVNGGGQFVVGGVDGVGGGGGGAEAGEGGAGWSCSVSQCEYDPPETGAPTDWHVVAKPLVVEGHPLIQWLIIKGKASMLKQFFEVSMVIQNLSTEPVFSLSAGQATLNLPTGLSLAPTPVEQKASLHVGSIPAEGTGEASWIVRGDEEGEYQLSADYEAALEPFDAQIDAQAALATPLHVWGKQALEILVDGEKEKLYKGKPWAFELGVRDKADIPLYNVELQLEEEPHANFDWQPKQQFGEMLGELKPGQSAFVERPFIVLPDEDSEAEFNAPLSSATFAGEKIEAGKGITSVPPFLNPKTLSAPEDTPGYVHLHWEAVPKAEGYEVYSTPSLTTSFANEADPVAATPGGTTVTRLGPGATDAYADPAGSEARWYAVSAIVEGAPVLELNAVHAAKTPGVSPPELGRCVKLAKGTGRYSSSKCTTEGGSLDYEWTPGAAKAAFATKLASGSVTLETTAGVKLTCTGETGAGEYAGAKYVHGVTLTLSGCSEGAQQCSSSGAGAGEIRSAALEGVLGVEKLGATQEKDKTALSLYPPAHTGPIAQFSCGASSVSLTGAVLVPFKADSATSVQTLKLKAAKGKQKPERFVGGATEVLEESVEGGEPKQAGLNATLTLTGEEPIEVNTVL
ncbi:MAG: PKD domain-containing protein [Solirubrobacteraceae bacterium]